MKQELAARDNLIIQTLAIRAGPSAQINYQGTPNKLSTANPQSTHRWLAETITRSTTCFVAAAHAVPRRAVAALHLQDYPPVVAAESSPGHRQAVCPYS